MKRFYYRIAPNIKSGKIGNQNRPTAIVTVKLLKPNTSYCNSYCQVTVTVDTKLQNLLHGSHDCHKIMHKFEHV